MITFDRHESWCPNGKRIPPRNHEDAAKRLADTYNLHRLVMNLDAVGKWFAVSLTEGKGDGVLYDSKRECVIHQRHMEQYYTFIKIAPCDMKVCEAHVMLATARRLYDKGMRMTDPDHRHGGLDLITRLTVEDQLAQMRGRTRNLIMPWEAN